MRISIHIATKDRITELGCLLTSLICQSFQDWDLVICDASKPQPAANHKTINDLLNRIKLTHGVQYIKEEIPLGIGRARNKMLHEDRFVNEWILRVDDDTICESDYIEKLVGLIRANYSEDGECLNIAAVGGIVPLLGGPNIMRTKKDVKDGIFNKIEFDHEGNITFIGDDGGVQYLLDFDGLLISHHLRSSFLFSRSAAVKVGGFPEELGTSGFREETIFCLKLAWAGYKMLTDINAINWHIQTPSGGTKNNDYAQQVMVCDEHFRRWARYNFEKKGNPYE